ncbi:MAG: glycosyltransferase [Galactobacillus timonensis]|uniref:glycosyltransferase family 2 protein n=1 Tax=Galactobacillus timonensis TaxID=2041840 RepID=UPI0023F12B05|nr:glycosyltransferase family 2 protein [Galactobacillus timonensis]MCI6066927.1 glycosyltransferase [Galactobacillus timonensis]MCI6753925.1 glycosyltransferase [Galactobacillus timonensis]MDD7087714.1 glycosyltransferase family 2 protein [Galactobacillus timonensis]MDY5221799.1 glycosyltransferase family 2 protein [Lachnospiraceae bacterium]
MPEVSIVVPVYKAEAYLDQCAQSIFAQTFRDFEVIFVDDGSPDGCPAMLDGYAKKDPRVRVIHKTNGGLSDARNAGMKIARGTYIQFIDSDDFLEPDLLEECVRKLRETGADMVIFDYAQYYMSTGTKEEIRNVFSEKETYQLSDHPELLTSIANAAWNKMYRLSLFRDYGIEYPWGYFYEDLGTTYRLLARANKVAFVNQVLYDYRQDRPGNITGTFDIRAFHVLDMVKINLDDYQQLGIYEKYYEELKFLGCVNILECLKKTRTAGDHALALKFVQVCFWFIRSHWPEFPKCRYKIARQKGDWIYTSEPRLRLYLKWKWKGE